MLNEFNPFTDKASEETEHGIINYQNSMGTCYVTHRKKEHFFIKYKGFAISKSELEMAYNRRVYWILIMYHKVDGTTQPFRMKLEDVVYLQEHNNKGDVQKVFPLAEMQTRKEGGWE